MYMNRYHGLWRHLLDKSQVVSNTSTRYIIAWLLTYYSSSIISFLLRSS